MRFKHDKDRKQFENPPVFVDVAAHFVLRCTVQIIDLISVVFGCGEIWITCYIADRSYKSQHPMGLAIDIRCHQTGEGSKPRKWYYAMEVLGRMLNMLNDNIMFVMHSHQYGTPNEHVHVHVLNGDRE